MRPEFYLLFPENGELYSWGHGGYGQLGHIENDKSIPALVKTNLNDKKVVQVACGSYHSVALTTNGEVCMFLLNINILSAIII